MLLHYNTESHLLCSLQLYSAVYRAEGSRDFSSSAPKSLSCTIKLSIAFSANIDAFYSLLQDIIVFICCVPGLRCIYNLLVHILEVL